jgi:CRP/FNR family cyclic AMP-dependent transcriptional regulator
MSVPETTARLSSVPLFAPLPPADLADLSSRFVARTFRRGARIFRQGETGDALFVVDQGSVRISTLAADGREVILAVIGAGEVFGELSLFDAGVRSADATALEDSRLLALSLDVFRPYLESHPRVAIALLGVLAGRIRSTDQALQDALYSDVPGRLAKRLLDLAVRYGQEAEGRTVIELAITQDELARMVGSSRESVNKALSSFISRGVLGQHDRRYVILDPAYLRRRAG